MSVLKYINRWILSVSAECGSCWQCLPDLGGELHLSLDDEGLLRVGWHAGLFLHNKGAAEIQSASLITPQSPPTFPNDITFT